ncbi:MAG: lysophospholipid acyltransferase family protein [Balneolaceae bacterium]
MSDRLPSAEIAVSTSRFWSRSIALYSRWLIRRRFHAVWTRESYQPTSKRSTLYFLNHSRWWDGLIPLLLNEFKFHQQARAMMDREQWDQYPFFRHLGAFPVDLDQPRRAVPSLRYASDWLASPGHSLFLYPEGKFYPAHLRERTFQPGLEWLSRQHESMDLVPIGIVTQHYRASRPELFLKVGPRVEPGSNLEFALKRSLDELDRLSHTENRDELQSTFNCWIGRSRS